MVHSTRLAFSIKNKGSASMYDAMKNTLLHLRNETHTTKGKVEQPALRKIRHNSEIRTHPHPKDTVTGIYEQPQIIKSSKPNNTKVPKSMLRRREELNKNLSTEKEYHGIDWMPEFATSNLSRTSLHAKSEFDGLIKDWITTNWLNVSPIIQQRPCHIFIHDQLLFKNLNLVDIVYNIILEQIPELKATPKNTITSLWYNEMDRILSSRQGNMTNPQIERSLKDIIKNVFLPFLKHSNSATEKLHSFIKDSLLVRKIVLSLYKNVKFDERMFGKVKNIENLNERNDITIVKDNGLGFVPSLDYVNLLKKVNNKKKNSLNRLNVLKYKSIFGNKVNDYENLQILKHMLVNTKLHCNEKFILLTNERASSLEYFRLLKLFNKTYSNLKLKGCVIYINKDQAKQVNEVMGEKTYTGKEMYYVVEEFSDIYDIIEVL